jgi:uncharacterized protein (TIGR04222 family)
VSTTRPEANERRELDRACAASAHAELWARLQRFELDPDDAPGTFTARLARENDWSLDYAQRVCDEYKRFAFLSVVAGHPCTPSDQVDQAWHLHLLHTRSYWEAFCPRILGTPLHHSPTRGGAQEAAKFRAWYRTTLDSYRAWFEDAPPEDIWPSVEHRFSVQHVRVRRRTARGRHRSFSLAAVSLAAGLTAAGCSLVAAVPPFDASGPRFLAFFLVLWAATLALCAVLRARFARAHGSTTTVELGPYEVAHLAGGEQAVARALIATLVDQGELKVAVDGKRLITGECVADRSDPLERAAVQRCAQSGALGCSVEGVREVVAAHSAQLSAALERAGLVFPEPLSRRWMLLALIAPAFGAIKLVTGLALHKPVGLLFLLCAASVFVAFRWLGTAQRITPAGTALLRRVQLDTKAQLASADGALATSVPIGLAVGLFGTAILADTALAELGGVLASPSDSNAGGDSGGDGGDAGGGCGGDGCGGCCGCGGCGG